MGSDGAWDSLLSMWSHFSSFLSLCLSGVLIVACVLYLRQHKDIAGYLMLAGKLVGVVNRIAHLSFIRWGMDAFKETHSYTDLGWIVSGFALVGMVGYILFVVGFWFLIRSVTEGTGNINHLRWWWPILAVFFLVLCQDAVMAAACIVYLRKYKNTAGYLMLTSSLIGVVLTIIAYLNIAFTSLDWFLDWEKFYFALSGFVGIVESFLFAVGFWLLIRSLIVRNAENEA